jgi:hypothetical protein
MINKMLANTAVVEVLVVYKGVSYTATKESVTQAIQVGNISELVPGLEVDCKIDSFRNVNGILEITLSNSDILIDKATVVTNLIDTIQQKGIGMSHVQVVLDSVKEYDYDGNVVNQTMNNYIGFVRLPENLASRKKVFKTQELVLRDGKNHIRVGLDSKNPATLEILSVDYRNDEEQGNLILKHGLYMFMDKFGMYSLYKKQGKWLVNLEGEETIEFNSVIDSNNVMKQGWTKYAPFGASPSNERQKVIYMIDVTQGNERANNALYVLTYGGFDLNKVGSEMTFEELAKVSSRWFQWMAPSTSMGLIEAYAIYCGKFNNDAADGEAIRTSASISKHVFNKYGIKISPRVLQGMFEQSRDGQSKVGTMPTSTELLKEMIAHLDANPIFLLREEITPEIQATIEDGMKGKGEYAERVVCIGSKNIDEIETLYDTNGMKSSFDFSIQLEYTLLRILRSNESNLSKSVFEKMLAKDKDKAVEVVTELLVDSVFSKVDNTYISAKPSVLNPEVFNKETLFMDEILTSVFPSYVKMDRNLSLNVVDNITKAVNKILNKFKVPMGGKNSGITVGIESFFGMESFIGDHEVFCPAAERILKKEERAVEDWKLFMIKYPSMDINEYSVAKVIGFSELKARVKVAQKELGFSKKRMNMFIEYYATLHDSVMVVPTCELFKNKHAGSDFDTDQVAWSVSKNITDLLVQDSENNVAVVIK